ncbi:GPI inositol-deacylase C [Perilla frutescens var. hirtella]|uniref:GPI inositol-deacylase C n=1 Tax=Perilla frutescens var. hirtella TaxID=608512 RepID=A0AAD4JHW3_PERFH|nr:GPI inositol-deacylase C [Perilla frutescens var. hirtella]
MASGEEDFKEVPCHSSHELMLEVRIVVDEEFEGFGFTGKNELINEKPIVIGFLLLLDFELLTGKGLLFLLLLDFELLTGWDCQALKSWCQAARTSGRARSAKHLRVWIFECKGRSHDAFVLGVTAATLLGVAHIVANLLVFCGASIQNDSQKSPPSKKFSKALLVFTWIIFLVGVTMLVIGTRSNDKSGIKCGFTYHNFLPTGGILCLVHAFLSLAYYVTSAAALYTN